MQQTMESEVQAGEPIIKKLYSQLNEEKLVKDISAIRLQRLKTLDDLVVEFRSAGKVEDVRKILDETLTESPESGCRAQVRHGYPGRGQAQGRRLYQAGRRDLRPHQGLQGPRGLLEPGRPARPQGSALLRTARARARGQPREGARRRLFREP